jgi:hypothetical protein
MERLLVGLGVLGVKGILGNKGWRRWAGSNDEEIVRDLELDALGCLGDGNVVEGDKLGDRKNLMWTDRRWPGAYILVFWTKGFGGD